ncbi:MAG: phytanoyl-CoA dioxygenase family protein [Caldilineaceae bacterium]|nr:phytanoyl-CoA dioxygenase family protein [Caldilineaceae bacterium]
MFDYQPISNEQLQQFDNEGYLIIRNALDSATISTLIAAGDRLIASDRTLNRQRRHDGRYDGFRNAITLDDAFIPLLTHPIILPIVVQLLGANLQLMTSHLIYKQPDPPDTPPTHRDPGWHRDYLQAMNDLGHFSIPRLELKCAYYFTDLSQPNTGATMMVPGSNQLKTAITIPEGATDPVGAIEPQLNPGDCLLFENRTYHAGAANLSSWTRKGIMIGYGYRWVMPMDFRQQEPAFVEKLTPLERYLVGEAHEAVDGFQPDGGANPLKQWCDAHGVTPFRHLTAAGDYVAYGRR